MLIISQTIDYMMAFYTRPASAVTHNNILERNTQDTLIFIAKWTRWLRRPIRSPTNASASFLCLMSRSRRTPAQNAIHIQHTNNQSRILVIASTTGRLFLYELYSIIIHSLTLIIFENKPIQCASTTPATGLRWVCWPWDSCWCGGDRVSSTVRA